jgi:hypothetical protein
VIKPDSTHQYNLERKYQSTGERKIATFLDNYDIPYRYQSPVLVDDNGYQRIWYPDFHLPKYSIYLEYFGIQNDPEYDRRTAHKLEAYHNSNLDVISVYPSTLQNNYKKYILGEIHQIMEHRLSDLELKIQSHQGKLYKPNRQFLNGYARRGTGYR